MRGYHLYIGDDEMSDDRKDRSALSLKLTATWLSFIPKWLRYLIVIAGLIWLVHLANN